MVTDLTSDGLAPDGLPVDPALVAEMAALTEEEATRRHAELSREIEAANKAYYEADAPILTDAEWDQRFRRLVALEVAFPALITPDSPTQRVSGEATSGCTAHIPHIPHNRCNPRPHRSERLSART